MTNQLRVVTVENEYLESANRMIDEFKAEQFEAVMLVGFKDGKMKTYWSKMKNTQEIIGCLEVIKHDLIVSE